MNNDIWNAMRMSLEKKVIKAVLELYEHNPGFAKFVVKVPNTTPKLLIVLELK